MASRVLSATIAVLMAGAGLNVYAAEPVASGLGKIKLNGLVQVWYQTDKSAVPDDAFRIRRAELRASGEINPQVLWAVTLDGAAVREDDVTTSGNNVTSVGRKSPLQDVFVTYKPLPSLAIDLGQYKIPFGMEGLESSAKLEFAERSALATQFKWTDWRDLGVTLRYFGKLAGIDCQAHVGVFNGDGQNRSDTNESKDLVGRFGVFPVERLWLGYAFREGRSGTSASNRNSYGGFEAKYDWAAFSVKGEYAAGDVKDVKKLTYYGSAGWKFMRQLQAAVRYDFWDPNTGANNDARSDTTIGLNYFLQNNCKVQLNYVLRQEEGARIENDVFLMNFQVTTY